MSNNSQTFGWHQFAALSSLQIVTPTEKQSNSTIISKQNRSSRTSKKQEREKRLLDLPFTN
jgi:hypothetical protein